MRDALLKGGVARYGQVLATGFSLKKEIDLSHGLLLQCFVGSRDEVFEEFFYFLIQPWEPVATGTPFWQETQIPIPIFDLTFSKLLLPALEAPHGDIRRHVPLPEGCKSCVTLGCHFKVLRLGSL